MSNEDALTAKLKKADPSVHDLLAAMHLLTKMLGTNEEPENARNLLRDLARRIKEGFPDFNERALAILKSAGEEAPTPVAV